MVLASAFNRVYVVIGASRGLGASIVNICLEHGFNVVGIGRTEEKNIKLISEWNKSGRFKYIQLDIGNRNCKDKLKGVIDMYNNIPFCIVFNAAVTESDVETNGIINFDILYRTNYTGIDGFAHTLEVFGVHLVLHGGFLVGISSLSALVPPIDGGKIAYPASKAYLDMALRSLRLLWGKRVHVMNIHLGHINEEGSWFIPRYNVIAQKIVKATLRSHPPKSICEPPIYCIAYGIMKMIPDRVISNTVKLIRSLLSRISLKRRLQ